MDINFKQRVLHISVLIIITSGSFLLGQQKTWDSWDKNYRKVHYKDVINAESLYADSVEKDKTITQYYSRLDKYRLEARYRGKFRKIDDGIFKSMKRVFKLFVGNPNQLNETVTQEVLFEIDGSEIWMPIQAVLIAPLKEEVLIGDNITLYCLFLNEHAEGKILYNTFFISEFSTQGNEIEEEDN